jgi:hypothetical protein
VGSQIEEAPVINSMTSGNVPLKVSALAGSIAILDEGVTAEGLDADGFFKHVGTRCVFDLTSIVERRP